MDYTAFRKNVQDMFQTNLGVTMVPGQLEGPNEWSATTWLGSVAIAKVTENPRNVAEVHIYLLCRFFAPYKPPISPNEPYDPAPLEQMAEKIQLLVRSNQTGLGAWFQRVTGLEFDLVDQGIQATFQATAENDGISLA
jgi:hypothetical protein